MLANGLNEQLLSLPALQAIVGTHIYPVTAPEDISQYPCVTYQIVSDVEEYMLSGAVNFSTKRIIINAWSEKYSDCVAIIESIRSALSGFFGTLPDGTMVFSCRVANVQDFYETQALIYRTSLHLLFQHGQETPPS